MYSRRVPSFLGANKTLYAISEIDGRMNSFSRYFSIYFFRKSSFFFESDISFS